MMIKRRLAMLGMLWVAAFGCVAVSSPARARARARARGRSDELSATTVEDVCGPPVPNVVSCDAPVVVSRKTHRAVHPKVRRVRVHANALVGTSAPDSETPQYLQQAYDLTALSATQGSGDTVAVVGIYNAPDAASDLATFRSTYHLPACTVSNGCFRQTNAHGQTSPLPSFNSGWSQEESMDIDAVSAICPRCKIDLVEADSPNGDDLQDAMVEAISLGADQVSVSGTDEASSDPFSDFNHAGVSIFAAAGDAGVISSGEANYPAALPFVNAVGGTSLAPQSSSAPTARGVAETAWASSGTGCATNEAPLPYAPVLGCAGRMYADISADADPLSGMKFYDTRGGGWLIGGGTSLSTPLTAAFAAITGVDATTPQWAYTNTETLNAPALGAVGSCAGQIYVACGATGDGYSGQAGAGSICGDIVAGAPGIGDPSYGDTAGKHYVVNIHDNSVELAGGVYPNNEPTTYYWEYGPTTAYGFRTQAVSAGSFSGASAVTNTITHLKSGLVYHYRLVATNASGTAWGYDYWLRTSGPVSNTTGLSMH